MSARTKAKSTEYSQRDYAKHGSRRREAAKRRYWQIRLDLYETFGSKCERCGFSDLRALQLDHIASNGAEERRSLSQTQIYQRAVEHPEEYQLLCANCNWIKGHADGPTTIDQVKGLS